MEYVLHTLLCLVFFPLHHNNSEIHPMCYIYQYFILFITDYFPIECIWHVHFGYPFTDGHLDCLQFGGSVSEGVHIFVRVNFFRGNY